MGSGFQVYRIGNSVVWGQGLPHGDKFTTMFYRALTGQEWAEDADIVILDGGINDVLATVLSNTDTEDVLDPQIRAACYDGMLAVLRAARERFPHAVLLVLGYYPLLSTHSDWHKSKIFLFFHGPFGLIPDLIAKKVTRNALYFHRRQLHWLCRAVAEANQDRTLRGPGMVFVTPAFRRNNSIFAGNPLLFQPRRFRNSGRAYPLSKGK